MVKLYSLYSTNEGYYIHNGGAKYISPWQICRMPSVVYMAAWSYWAPIPSEPSTGSRSITFSPLSITTLGLWGHRFFSHVACGRNHATAIFGLGKNFFL